MPDRKQSILDAALAIADEQGLAAVSMRAVAERAGLTAMALYPYVGSKAELLDEMVGRLLTELLPDAAPGQDWRQRIGALGRAARLLTHRHPWAASLLFSRPSVAPDAARVVDLLYQALLDAGVPAAQVPRLERLVSTFVIGYAASEVGGRFDSAEQNPRAPRTRLPDGTLPAHQALARWLAAPVDWDAEFEAGLDDLRRLIETAAG
jgi:AcrR family transcriptional regulator